jgi:hypothetical protein
VRKYWGDTLGAKAHAEEFDLIEAAQELHDMLTHEVMLSGEFDQMAVALSWRVAARLSMAGTAPDEKAIAEQRKEFFARAGINADGVSDWVEGLGRDANWLEEMFALEAAYQRSRSTLVTEELCRTELRSVRLQYIRIDLELIELESRDAASEALMCVRKDGQSLAEVAREGSYPHQRVTALLEDLLPDIHERVLCAAPGETLEPLPHGDGFQVCLIHGKSEPSLDDSEIRRRIEDRLLGQAFADLCARFIRWELPLTPNP